MQEFLSKQDCSLESRISVRSWERIIANGDVDIVRIGRRVLVPRESFLAFMASRTTRQSIVDVREKLRLLGKKALEGRRAS